MESKHLPRPAASALLIIGIACAAVSNPNRERLRPVGLPAAHPALPEAPAEPSLGNEPAARPPKPASDAVPGPAARAGTDPMPAPQAGAPGANGSEIAVAQVGNEVVDARRMLARMWLRSSDQMREALDHLVIERIALIEADRLGIAVTSDQVEARLAETRAALETQLQQTSPNLSIEQYIRENLGVDPQFYDRQMRQETIAQLVAERVVRAWVLSTERADVRILEAADRAQVDAARTELDDGELFVDVAGRFHVDQGAPGGVPLTLVRSQNSELARVAFATAEGDVSGPIEDQGRFLLMWVEKRHPALEGAWDKIGRAVEQSLASEGVGEFEFVQWRAQAVAVHSVDLSPFFEMIGSPAGP